jgi:hypothetical protein
MKRKEADHSSLRAKSRHGELDITGPGLVVVAAVCVAGIAWVAVRARGDTSFINLLALLALFALAGLAINAYHSLKLARFSTEHSADLARMSKDLVAEHSAQLARLITSTSRISTAVNLALRASPGTAQAEVNQPDDAGEADQDT